VRADLHLPGMRSIRPERSINEHGAAERGLGGRRFLGHSPARLDRHSLASMRHQDRKRHALEHGSRFLLALAVGVIAVFVIKSPALAVLAIFGYFIYGLWLPKSQRNTERFADSLYYLGFIFTLGALFVAMTPWFNNMGELTSRTIIEQFGIATATTFVGMTLRIILIQLRQTTTDQEEEARDAIAKYVRDLNREIRAALTEIAEFRGRAAKMAEDSIREIERERWQASEMPIRSSPATPMRLFPRSWIELLSTFKMQCES